MLCIYEYIVIKSIDVASQWAEFNVPFKAQVILPCKKSTAGSKDVSMSTNGEIFFRIVWNILILY